MMDHPMHEHELDLIMALAEGSLSDAELDAAEGTIAACDGCASELAAQRLALTALRAAPSPSLTELEGARMRRALRDELGLVSPTPVAAEPSRRVIPWQRLSVALSAAAVLVLFIALVPALDLFGGGAEDSAENAVAIASTTVVLDEALPQSDGAQELTAANRDSVPTTTQTAMGIPTDDGLIVDFGANPDLALIQSASQLGLTETGDAANLFDYGFDLDSLQIDPGVDECIEQALATFADGRTPVVLGIGTLLDEEVFLVAYVDDATTTVELVAHEASTCRVVTSED